MGLPNVYCEIFYWRDVTSYFIMTYRVKVWDSFVNIR
jgi:hypothetical protein